MFLPIVAIVISVVSSSSLTHFSGGGCQNVVPKPGFETPSWWHVSEAQCRANCLADPQCDFFATLNQIAYGAGWPPLCAHWRNAYCDISTLTKNHDWYEFYYKPSGVLPVSTQTPTVQPSAFPTVKPTSSPSVNPSSSPSLNPSSSPTLTPTTNPSKRPTAEDFIVKIKAFHGEPKDVLDASKFQDQPEVDAEFFGFEHDLTPFTRRLLKRFYDLGEQGFGREDDLEQEFA